MEKVDVFDLIERIAALIRSEERKKCTAVGLQTVHLQALNYLSRCNKYSDTPAALTNYLGMTKGTVSQSLSLLEKANQSQSFGLCKTCHYFTTMDDSFLCGVTKELLSQNDSEKICQEHTVVLWHL